GAHTQDPTQDEYFEHNRTRRQPGRQGRRINLLTCLPKDEKEEEHPTDRSAVAATRGPRLPCTAVGKLPEVSRSSPTTSPPHNSTASGLNERPSARTVSSQLKLHLPPVARLARRIPPPGGPRLMHAFHHNSTALKSESAGSSQPETLPWPFPLSLSSVPVTAEVPPRIDTGLSPIPR
ncbi:unnamed protein product, partial [Hapterophycus canaliculatus]